MPQAAGSVGQRLALGQRMAAVAAGLGAGQVAVQVHVERAGQVACGIAAFAGSGIGQVEAAVEQHQRCAAGTQGQQFGGGDQIAVDGHRGFQLSGGALTATGARPQPAWRPGRPPRSAPCRQGPSRTTGRRTAARRRTTENSDAQVLQAGVDQRAADGEGARHHQLRGGGQQRRRPAAARHRTGRGRLTPVHSIDAAPATTPPNEK